MNAEIIAVGTELLLGDIVNTNAAWIGRALADRGVDLYQHTVVGDNESRMAEAITAALARADAVIVTGGLGPTQDDITREAIAQVTGRALRRDRGVEESLRQRFEDLGRPMAETNLRQADVPEGAGIIETTFGTAPGLIVEHGGRVIYALPGVPAEMREMMERAVLPDLARRAGVPSRLMTRVVRIAGVSESSIAKALEPMWGSLGEDVKMAFLAGGGEVRIRLTTKADEAAEGDRALAAAEAVVREHMGAAVVGTDDQTLPAVVLARLRDRGWRLAVAESMTGGAIAARLVDIPGASDVFVGGVVAYDAAVKREVLGVSDGLIDEAGIVSGPVAAAMARGVIACTGADVGVGLTGVAGPGAHDREPGVVCIAVAGAAGEQVRELRLPGDRATIRTLAVAAALNLVRLTVLEGASPGSS